MKIYYLRGALGDSHLLNEHKTVIEQLVSCDYHSSDLEKLRGHEIYSFRLSIEKRLLFSLEKINGQLYMVVLDYLPTHDYQKSPFLKSGMLRAYLSRNRKAHESLVEDIQFDAISDIDLSGLHTESALQRETRFEPVEYHQKHLFVLNQAQHEATSLQLPGLCSGVAGSGKSALVFPMFFSYLSQVTHDEAQQPAILYVTKSDDLVRLMRDSFESFPLGEQYRNAVHFKTMHDLIREDNPDIELVNKADFMSWYKAYKNKEKLIAKTVKQDIPDIEDECCYQEFRIASGLTAEEYFNLSEQQSSLPKRPAKDKYSERGWVYRALQEYCQSLAERKKMNPDFYSFQKPTQYSLVVVDESQDLSHRQLCELGRLALNQQILFLMDSHQRLYDTRSVRPFLLHHFGIRNPIELEVTHRCPWRITEIANTVIATKQQLAGGIADKHEPRCFIGAKENDAGHAYLLTEHQLTDNPWIQSVVGEPYCAIVTRAEHIDEVRQIFPKSVLVFTPEQIKGLEYDVVVTYRLLDNEWCKQASHRYAAVSNTSPTHQAQRGEYVDTFVPELNQLNTAITRSSRVLVMGLNRTHENEFLYNRILPLSETKTPDESCLQGLENSVSWEDELLRLYDRGNRELASLILTRKLNKPETELDSMVNVLRAPHQKPSFNQGQPESFRPLVAFLDPEALLTAPPTHMKTPQSNSFSEASTSCGVSPVNTTPTPEELPKPVVSTDNTKILLEKKMACDLIEALNQFNLASTDKQIAKAEVNIAILLKKYSTQKLWIESKTTILYEYLNQPHYCKVFVAYLVNNYGIIDHIPHKEILPKIKKEFRHLHDNLLEITEFIKRCQRMVRNILSRDVSAQLMHGLVVKPERNFLDYLRKLHAYGGNLNKPVDGTGEAAVHFAVIKGGAGTVRLLGELGADLNKPNIYGETPAHLAARFGNDSTLGALYELGADLNQSKDGGETPAFLAAQMGHVKCIKVLMDANVDFKATLLIDRSYLIELSRIQPTRDVFHKIMNYLSKMASGKDSKVSISPLNIAIIMEQLEAVSFISLTLNSKATSTLVRTQGLFAQNTTDKLPESDSPLPSGTATQCDC